MDKDEIRTTIRQIIADQMGTSLSEITGDSHLEKDFGADSLDAVELVMEMEDEFDVVIPDEEMGKAKTVKDLYALAEKYISERE